MFKYSEVIKSLGAPNDPNTKNFIEKYGRIKDRMDAIEAIIINPYAYYVLDVTLQTDPEVLIYWYPITATRTTIIDYESAEKFYGHPDPESVGLIHTEFTTAPQRPFPVVDEKFEERYQQNLEFLICNSTDFESSFSKGAPAVFHEMLLQQIPLRENVNCSQGTNTKFTLTATLERRLILPTVGELIEENRLIHHQQ